MQLYEEYGTMILVLIKAPTVGCVFFGGPFSNSLPASGCVRAPPPSDHQPDWELSRAVSKS